MTKGAQFIPQNVIIDKDGYIYVAYMSQWKFVRNNMPRFWLGADRVYVFETFPSQYRSISRKRTIYRKASIT